MTSVYETGIYKVVELAGGVSALGRALHVSRQAIYMWLTRGYVPLKRAIQMEEMYAVPRATLVDERLRSLLNGPMGSASSQMMLTPYQPRK